jgi:hypothetical protein
MEKQSKDKKEVPRLVWPCPSHQSAYCLPSILMIVVKQLVYIIRPLVNIT